MNGMNGENGENGEEIKKERYPVKYFDMITQNTYDICSHLNFVETFKGAIIGENEHAIIAQYKKHTGCPSPGFRFLLRTRPGAVYRVSLEGFLHKGDEAVFFIESVKPVLKIVPKNKAFKNNVLNKFNLNFRAISNLTTIGILFKCHKENYCLSLTEFKVCKYDECLLPISCGCDSRDGFCKGECSKYYDEYPPKKPACFIKDPPTVKQLCPKPPLLDCLDEKVNEHCKQIDLCGKTVPFLNDISCNETGSMLLETSSCTLYICDGLNYIQLLNQKENFLFQDVKNREIWKVKNGECRKLSNY